MLGPVEPLAEAGEVDRCGRPCGDAEGGNMTQSQQVQPPPQSPQPTRQWTLVATAPEWFRRIWNERSRELPKGVEFNQTRIRRITYL